MDGQDGGDGNWVAGLAADVEASRFAGYLLDPAVVDQAAKDLTAYLRDELGVPVPNALVRVGLRLLAGALYDRGKKGADRVLSGTLAASVGMFARLPYCDRFCEAFRAWLRCKAEDGEARAQFDALVKGDRSSIDPKLLASLSADMRFQLRQLSEMAELRDALDAGFGEVLARLDPQPQLDGKLLAESDHARLHFGSGRVPFVGRENELDRLCAFLAMDGAFRWWTLLGEGGMGKSRLALELCLRAGMHWRAGFLPQGQLAFDWSQWRPESPTLLVVDYAAAVPEEVGSMLDALRLRASNAPLDHPVRVLLLERRREDRWWNAMLGAGDRAALEQSAIKEGAPLEVATLGDDGLWAIVRSLGGSRADALGRETALTRLREIDREGRPLFAALAGEALAAGADLHQWNKTDLLADWLRRERERHWRRAGVDDAHANLAALATMTGGIFDDVLTHPPAGIALPSPDTVSPAAYAAITGRWPAEATRTDGAEVFIFLHLEPDILGTWFVLEHLRDPMGRGVGTPAARIARADCYRNAAWSRNERGTLGFAAFIDRAKDDFLDASVFRCLLYPPIGGAECARLYWSMLGVNLVTALGEAGDIACASAQLDALERLAREYGNEPLLRLEFARSTVNIIATLGNAKKTAQACSRLDALERLAAKHIHEPALRLEFAKGSVNLILMLGDAVGASARLDVLERLAEVYCDEPELRVRFAQGSFNLIQVLASVKDLRGAGMRLDALGLVAAKYSDEPALRLGFAKGSVNLIQALGCANVWVSALKRLEVLEQLAADYVDEPILLQVFAEGCHNLIMDLADAGDMDGACARLNTLGHLAKEHADAPDLCGIAGLAALALLDGCRATRDWQRATDLTRVFKSYISNPTARIRLVEILGVDSARSLEDWIAGLDGGA